MDRDTLQLAIAPKRQIARDLRSNVGWLTLVFIVIAAWVLLSAFLIRLTEGWTYGYSLYFTIINVTTVGFGDATAKTDWGRVISCANAVAGPVAFGVFVALLTLAVQPGEFTGTASPASAQGDTLRDEASRASRAATDLLRSLVDLLRDPHLQQGGGAVFRAQLAGPATHEVALHIKVRAVDGTVSS
jgi:hypothetical protein